MMQDSAKYDFDISLMNNDKIHTCDFKWVYSIIFGMPLVSLNYFATLEVAVFNDYFM